MVKARGQGSTEDPVRLHAGRGTCKSLLVHLKKIVLSAAIAETTLAVIVLRELRARYPVVPVVLKRMADFWAYSHMGFCVSFTLFGEIFVLCLYLQQARGLSPFMTGVSLLPVIGLTPVSRP
jgi:DHA2 family methylenomycin A resistance protein-like MFS transporter